MRFSIVENSQGSGAGTWLLRAGAAVPLVFFATTFLCGWMMGGYNHASRLVSELGAVGARSRYWFTGGLLLCCLLGALFAAGLIRACRETGRGTLPAWILIFLAVSFAGAGIVPLPLRMHLYAGLPSTLTPLSPLAALALWRGERSLPGLVPAAALSFLLMALGGTAFFPGVLADIAGIKQRLFHAGWSIWFLYLSLAFTRKRSH
ncbi:MAG: DUF998 domain-containing protein [Acidobacteriota bacterium]|nr:DUF998 domain-containing protein [Acidobacteriota bacterium]